MAISKIKPPSVNFTLLTLDSSTHVKTLITVIHVLVGHGSDPRDWFRVQRVQLLEETITFRFICIICVMFMASCFELMNTSHRREKRLVVRAQNRMAKLLRESQTMRAKIDESNRWRVNVNLESERSKGEDVDNDMCH